MQKRSPKETLNVLYSFPHRLGKSRICTTAWYEIQESANAGAHLHVLAGDSVKGFSGNVRVQKTLSFGSARIPGRILGTYWTCVLHDWIVSRRLKKMSPNIDIIHTWPLGACRTLRVAKELGIPTVLERPNAHTRFAYKIVKEECDKLGLEMPAGHEHAHSERVLRREEAEYALATKLLCPSDFVLKTFLNAGFSPDKLVRHQYGFDGEVFTPGSQERPQDRPFTVAFVGGCAPRKGLHYALEAWVKSEASKQGKFIIVGTFIPGYREKLQPLLSHPTVQVLGQRSDVAEIMRHADVLTLPSLEEGSALVTSEGRGAGCVLAVSDAAGALCTDGWDAFIHAAGDVAALTEHFDCLSARPDVLARMRSASIAGLNCITWKAAGKRLAQVYRGLVNH